MKSVIRNEFAMVEVETSDSPSGSRLRVKDLRSGAEIYLDAIELESFTRAAHWQFSPLVDPSWLSVASEPDPDEV